MSRESSSVANGHDNNWMASNATERFARIKYILRIKSDNRAWVFVEPGSRDHVVQVRVSDLTTPKKLSLQLFLKKSLLIAPCLETKDGRWPVATWNQFLAEKLRVFSSESELMKWDSGHNEIEHATFFAVGNFVSHPRYGIGRVSEVGQIMRRQSVTVEFAKGFRRETFVAGRCPLSVVT